LPSATLLAEGGVDLLQALAIFALAAFLMGFGALLFGLLLRPRAKNPDKDSAYECGEVPVGAGWVQFDLRFYVVALIFLVFDVEIALFYPWAVVYGGATAADASWAALRQIRWAALWDMLFFFAVIVVGFLYLWRFGYLDWIRMTGGSTPAARPSATAGPNGWDDQARSARPVEPRPADSLAVAHADAARETGR
jgi:NADH-quinone oxidoreductase subunit A